MHPHQQLAPQLPPLPLLLQSPSMAVLALPHQLLLQQLSRDRPGVPPLRPPATMPTSPRGLQLPSTQVEAAHLPANLVLRKQVGSWVNFGDEMLMDSYLECMMLVKQYKA